MGMAPVAPSGPLAARRFGSGCSGQRRIHPHRSCQETQPMELVGQVFAVLFESKIWEKNQNTVERKFSRLQWTCYYLKGQEV